MRVHVDEEKGQSHNRCVALAPAPFEIDNYGTASAIDDVAVPPELEADAPAVDNRPEFAISVTDH